MEASTNATNQDYHVICIKWGTSYNENDVNLLYNMVKRNTSLPFTFHCFTDNNEGLDPAIVSHPMTTLDVAPEDNRYSYKKEAGLCDDNLGGLTGKRVLFLDLDVLIVDNIDCFLTYPEGDKFYIINDWNTKDDSVGQASCYSFVVGTLGFAKKNFEKSPKEMADKFGTASQEYLSDQVTKHFGGMNFWPEEWCKSFRFHCMPPSLLRRFIDAKMPAKVKIIAFHGSPKASDALIGKWTHRAPFLKRLLYKNCRPTPWIADYLK